MRETDLRTAQIDHLSQFRVSEKLRRSDPSLPTSTFRLRGLWWPIEIKDDLIIEPVNFCKLYHLLVSDCDLPESFRFEIIRLFRSLSTDLRVGMSEDGCINLIIDLKSLCDKSKSSINGLNSETESICLRYVPDQFGRFGADCFYTMSSSTEFPIEDRQLLSRIEQGCLYEIDCPVNDLFPPSINVEDEDGGSVLKLERIVNWEDSDHDISVLALTGEWFSIIHFEQLDEQDYRIVSIVSFNKISSYDYVREKDIEIMIESNELLPFNVNEVEILTYNQNITNIFVASIARAVNLI